MTRFRAAVAVYGLLRRDEEVLFLRRKGSGYRDGQLSLPAGHLEGGESAISGLIRELREEVVVEVAPQDCTLALVMHRRRESPGDDEYVDLFFDVRRWSGEPSIGEPHKCSELVWAAKPPHDTVDYIAVALASIGRGGLVVHGWDERLGQAARDHGKRQD